MDKIIKTKFLKNVQHKDSLPCWTWLIIRGQQTQNNGVNILGGSSSINKHHRAFHVPPLSDSQWVISDQDQNGGVRRLQSEAL